MQEMRLQDLSISFHNRSIFDNVNLIMNLKGMSVILGINGSGKSTFLELLIGMQKVKNGKIYLDNYNLNKIGIHQRFKLGFGYVPQKDIFVQELSVLDNLILFSPQTNQKKIICMAEEFSVQHIMKTKCQNLSFGEKVRIKMLCAMLNNPRLLILDEPFSGLDPIFVGKIQKLLLEIKTKGITLIIAEHMFEKLLLLADHFYFIHQKKIHYVGTAENFKTNPLIQGYFLGHE